MVKDNRPTEETTEAFSNIKKVNSLVQSGGKESFASLLSDYRAVQRKIDSALELIRQRNAEKERAKKRRIRQA